MNSRIGLYILLISVLITCSACDSRPSGATEQSVLANFSEFYLQTAEKKELKNRSLHHLQFMQDQNSDTYRTIAYTWNKEAQKKCAIKQRNSEDEIILSDYDKFVQKEKGNFHAQEIDDTMKPCIRSFYLNNWDAINKMLNFNIEVVKKQL